MAYGKRWQNRSSAYKSERRRIRERKRERERSKGNISNFAWKKQNFSGPHKSLADGLPLFDL